MDQTTSHALAAAIPTIVGLIIAFVVWSLKRNVKHEDDDKAAKDTKLTEHAKQLTEVREQYQRELAEVKRQMMQTAHEHQLASNDSRTQLASLNATLGELKGSLSGLREMFEEGREKQAQFYRGELKRVELDLRQELTRHAHPELPDRVSRVELELARLQPKTKARK